MWYSIKKKGFRMKEISIEDVLERVWKIISTNWDSQLAKSLFQTRSRACLRKFSVIWDSQFTKRFFQTCSGIWQKCWGQEIKNPLASELVPAFWSFALISDENYSKFRQVRKLLFCSWSFHAATAYACVSKSVELNCIKLCTKTEDKAWK